VSGAGSDFGPGEEADIGTSWRWSAWGISIALGLVAFLPSLSSAEDSPPAQRMFRLPYKNEGFSFRFSVDTEGREAVFKQEPDFGSHEVLRGALPVGPKPDDFVGFAWDQTAGKLYLDLNRDFDLTNDPDGVRASNADPVQEFSRIPLSTTTEGIVRDYLLDLKFMDFGRGPHLSAYIRSGWSGQVPLGGTNYHLAVVDNLDGTIDAEDQFIIREIEGSVEGEVQPDDEREGTAVPSVVAVGGKSYTLGFALDSSQTPADLNVTFTEAPGGVGTINIAGEHVQRLALDGPSRVEIVSPGVTASVPAGNYRVAEVVVPGFSSSLRPGFRPPVSVKPGEAATLKVGAPLNHSIEIIPRGHTFLLSYKLEGQGGETYSPDRIFTSKAPKFAVYKGGRKIASGNFRYG